MSNTHNDLSMAVGDPFSSSAFEELLKHLDDEARRLGPSMGLDWVASMEEAPAAHAPARQALTILQLGLFDEKYYLSTYSDIASAGIPGLLHYVNFGDREGRWPNQAFNPNFYRTQFDDGQLHSVCSLYHYAVMGEALGLKASNAFDPHRYLTSNPELRSWLDRPLTHFLHVGLAHGLMVNQRTRLPLSQKVKVNRTASPMVTGKLDLARGINVIGPLDKVSGLGVSARGYLDGLRAAGITALGSRAQQREFAIQKSVKGTSAFPAYLEDAAINVVHMNGDTLPIMMQDDGERLLKDKYNIAVWYWELPTLRPEWQVSMNYFHEFWAPTPFIAKALMQCTAKPVRLVPPYLAYLPSLQSQTQPAASASTFVYCFDANSILERKNPGALLDAFHLAFPKGSDEHSARLTFKITYPNRKIPEVARLYKAAAQDSRIKIIDHLLSDAELHSLIGSATAYVSPHRSEGLGLTVIEAMGAGVPVIATPFGGVDAFVTPEAAFPIDYRYVELAGDYVPYPQGFVWADPDVESLARQLSLVHRNRDEAARRARIARQQVLDFFSSTSLIDTYKSELNRISRLQ
jgi:glycosyltransferase involved in cell wall biosynthesis